MSEERVLACEHRAVEGGIYDHRISFGYTIRWEVKQDGSMVDTLSGRTLEPKPSARRIDDFPVEVPVPRLCPGCGQWAID